MRKLLNTLFISSEDIYLSLDGENVVANRKETQVARFPLHTLKGIVLYTVKHTQFLKGSTGIPAQGNTLFKPLKLCHLP